MEEYSPSFPQFSRLPPELRDMIWAYALPDSRVYEVLDAPTPSSSSQRSSAPANRLMFADARNEPPPLMATVCHDARQAVLHRYRPVAFSGTVKYIDLSRDVLLLDSYLQVKRLLKVMRLLTQIEALRNNVTKIALGTSWGLYTGLHLRMFHKSVQTKRNLARLMQYTSKFRKLRGLVLIVYQASAFKLKLRWPERDHHASWFNQGQNYPYNFNVNFNLDNYFLRRPCATRLVDYAPSVPDEKPELPPQPQYHHHHHYHQYQQQYQYQHQHQPQEFSPSTTPSPAPQPYQEQPQQPQSQPGMFDEGLKVCTASATTTATSGSPVCPTPTAKMYPHDPLPGGHQVHELRSTFEGWMDKIRNDNPPALADYHGPHLETATLTWIYSGWSNASYA